MALFLPSFCEVAPRLAVAVFLVSCSAQAQLSPTALTTPSALVLQSVTTPCPLAGRFVVLCFEESRVSDGCVDFPVETQHLAIELIASNSGTEN